MGHKPFSSKVLKKMHNKPTTKILINLRLGRFDIKFLSMGSKAIIAASAPDRKEINASPLREEPASLKTVLGKTPNNLLLRNSDLEKLLLQGI